MRRGGAGGLAVLPMYDRPEVRAETDALWTAMREAIRDRGLDAPEGLDRARPVRVAWSAPELVVGQTCGLPYVKALRGRVGLIGTPAYALEGCAPGQYRSAIVVGPRSRAERLEDLRGARPAINARDSQSGYGALMLAVAPLAGSGDFFAEAVTTGAHRASIEAVASGRADVAAIDAVSWALALRHDAVAAEVRVIAWTEPTPGLPLITGRAARAPLLAEAIGEAVAAVPEGVRKALLLTGLARTRPQDYDVIRDGLARAERSHALPGPQHLD